MEHLAIMNPRWNLIGKILAGEKTIESRWYVHKIAPWNKVFPGDIVYFKDAGKAVVARATVTEVVQTELSNLDEGVNLVQKYQKGLCFTQESLVDTSWLQKKKFAILMFLANAHSIDPFEVEKTGYGSACAWITVPSINSLRKLL